MDDRAVRRYVMTLMPTVNPFSEFLDLSREALKLLSQNFENECRPSDGHIYCQIRQYKDRDLVSERQWWTRLSISKSNDLRRFFNKSPLAQSLSRMLLNIPGMRDQLWIGSLGDVMASKSNEVSLPAFYHPRCLLLRGSCIFQYF